MDNLKKSKEFKIEKNALNFDLDKPIAIADFGLENEFITITEVQPTADLRYAKVFISCMGNEAKNVVETLNQTASLFSKLVARQLKTKYSPKLSFFVD